MMVKIDVESQEYKDEFAKTEKFVEKVYKQFNFLPNPNNEVNESVAMGLTRNKMIYGKRYCPCFMVIGETKEEQKAADNRVCPCKPAIEKEIPEQGYCHCGIFCSPEYVAEHCKDEEIDEVTHTHSRGLKKEECEILLKKEQLDGDELESLLEARSIGFIEFTLVDVREWMEWVQMRIVGTDALVPTTAFYEALSKIEDKKDIPVIVYCLTGSRSNYCMNVMKEMGYAQVSNLTYGIVSFHGNKESGE
jgi:ferredoxin-thioredoxin reductase catalytic subunit/rhodanese-related sulfurtransferase